jgi:hypothetical protein
LEQAALHPLERSSVGRTANGQRYRMGRGPPISVQRLPGLSDWTEPDAGRAQFPHRLRLDQFHGIGADRPDLRPALGVLEADALCPAVNPRAGTRARWARHAEATHI